MTYSDFSIEGRELKFFCVFLHYCFRTDFYLVSEDPNSAVGLPDGLAEKLIKHTFYKWIPKSDSVHEPKDIPAVTEETVISDNFEEHHDTSPNESHIDMSDTNKNFTCSEAYNGGLFDNYCWSQTIADIDITIKIPENCSKKNMLINIVPTSISVKTVQGQVLLEGEMCQKCKANDAIWSMDNGKLQIHLDKCQELWWDCLVLSEPKLDVSKIDCSRPYEDLPEEAQAKIEELQWNQERKRLGLPTSNELAMHETLKRAWDAEGSPFTGPFDPSLVKFN